MDFDGIKHKIAQKLTEWKAHILSNVGQVFLIKSNLGGFPQFLWIGLNFQFVKILIILLGISFGTKVKERDESSISVPTIAWNKICRTKCVGSLGISKTEDINSTFLAKQGWKILKQPNNIWLK